MIGSSSFGSLNRWIDTVKNVRGEDALILVIGMHFMWIYLGNKADLKAET